MPDVLNLIQQLAIFEKEPDAVEVTTSELTEHFHQNKFEVFIAEVDSKTVGMALFYERYSTWKGPYIHLEDLIVLPEFRGRGIGKRLLEWIIFESQERGARRLGWEVLDWNTPAVDFYKSMGADIEKEWWQCRMYSSALKNYTFSHLDEIKSIER